VTSNGEIFENNFDVCGVFFEQLLEFRHKPCTVRSLKITEDRNDDRCIHATLKW
jgi:hypothetical protein